MNFFRKTLHYLNDRNHRLLPKKSNFTKIIFILIACFTITFSIKTIFAADTSDTGREETTTTVPVLYNTETQKEVKDNQEALTGKDNINLQVWTKSSAIANGLLVVNTVGGSDVVAMASGNPSWVAGGFIGATNQVIASLYSRPISGIQYIADSINSFLGKPVYAQNNDGFNQLKGLQSIWKICRNTVYTLISIVFVIMGILIMLRIKISPQATVTIQNTIPKIIITLILVTFSYAICGLIIDATYLIQAVVLSLLINADTSNTFTGNLGLTNLIKGDMGTFSTLAWNVLWSTSNTTVVVFSAISGVVAAIVGILAFTSPYGALCFIIGAAIVLIFVLIQIVKFFFGCAKAYIILLIKFVSAPLEIALGAFPNSKIGFGSWFIQTLAYAAIFPICMIFLVFLTIVLNAVSLNQVWTPGILQGGLVSAAIRPILGLAGLIILAKLPDLIPEAIFQLKPSPFGKALGEGVTKNALVNRVRTGVNFATEQRIGNMFYGGYAEGQSAIGRFKSKYNIGKSGKKHESIDQNPKKSSINPQEEENTNSSTF